MILALIKFLEDNRKFIDEFTSTQSWFIRLENRLRMDNLATYEKFFAEISFDILAIREPGMAVITHNPSHRYSLGIKFSDGICWAYPIFSVVLQRGDISFEELKERIKEKVKETIFFGLDKSKEIICDLIDDIPEDRMVEI